LRSRVSEDAASRVASPPEEDCAADGVYEFFFCAPPLPITKGCGSPINPMAIK
jgi:hypothetical protein